MLFSLMPWIGLNHKKKKLLERSKKSEDATEVKKGLETLYRLVGERPVLRVCIYIYIHSYIRALILCDFTTQSRVSFS